ncbi:MAG: ABC transporter ATP-binding protein [Cereibacter sphaeroides]|uniref:ABC transporter ATP-binding protein n=1 Tax=Cereibacter sphaeroides TaxID=1063 RepID=A0A2W5UQ42_CERSP|nr:MAG: ABC transporter ATP-binding protein [Cereibacter sphaeroides]
MSGLSLDKLVVRRGAEVIVSLDAVVAPGEVLTIMGPSGSGKSTALAAIIGTLGRDFTLSGRLLLNGTDITAQPTQSRGIGLLFQDDVLFPHMSVGANLAFALPSALQGRRARQEAVDAALARADLAGFADRDPATLSGGQRARVALLRTLLARPRALLLDEPFARLDTELRARIRRFVLDRIREERLPAILVTHDPDDAFAAGGPVIDPCGRAV